MWAFLSTIFGGFISIGAVAFAEYLRRPSLVLAKDNPVDAAYSPGSPQVTQAQVTEMRTLRVKLSNRPLPWFASWMVRTPALQCRAAITFHHLDDEQDIFDRMMEGRWPNTSEPVPIVIPFVTPQGEQIALVPQARNWVDVQPGESEPLDIAIRADNDTECYGWNNEAYFSTPPWRNAH